MTEVVVIVVTYPLMFGHTLYMQSTKYMYIVGQTGEDLEYDRLLHKANLPYQIRRSGTYHKYILRCPHQSAL